MSRDFNHTLASFTGTPWAILPAKLDEMHAVLLARIARHGEANDPESRFYAGPRSGSGGDDRPFDQVGPVAVVGIRGVIMPRASMMTDFSGGVSAERLARSIDMAVADKTVSTILLDIDSPGGSVYGILEAGDKVYAARSSKRVIALANPVAASAAYWLAAQASEIVVTPSGEVGSIGIVAVHTDTSKADEIAGRKMTVISAGEFKAERAPFQPLSEAARASWQESADQHYAMFLAAVARGRGISAAQVADRFGQGRMKLAAEAVKSGMADRIGTLQSVLQELVSTAPVIRSGSSDAERRSRAMAVQFAEAGLPTN